MRASLEVNMRRARLLTLCIALLFAGCLTPDPPPSANYDKPLTTPGDEPFAPETITAYVVRADAPLRDEPGEKGLVLRYLDSGESVTILYPDRGDPWYEVQSDLTKQHGWIHASVIRLKAPAATVTPTPTRTTLPTPSPASTPPPPRRTPTPEPEEEEEAGGVNDVKVWVNTDSGVYHCPGTRWYGQTKQGTYMTQKEAVDAGHRPAYGQICGTSY